MKDVFKANERIGAGNCRQNISYGFYTFEITICFEDEGRTAGIEITGGEDNVLGLQVIEYRGYLYPDGGQFSRIDFEPNSLFLLAKQFDLANSLKRVELPPERFCRVPEFRV